MDVVLTFCICLLPFGSTDEHAKWEKATMRVVNVLIGCVLGALGSIVVCPKSTTAVIYENTGRQLRLAQARHVKLSWQVTEPKRESIHSP